MATDFYERQADARKSTRWLLGTFCIAVLAIVATVFVVVALAVSGGELAAVGDLSGDAASVALGSAAGALALIGGGSCFKVAALRSGGGRGVAEGVGGRALVRDGADAAAQRLLNVVEEMAIASGTPVPPVYLLEDDSINAFAAGYSSSDAVIGVTRGCVESLSRDELQGVVAHEFSHILNGDMRMSIRLIGILHGILLFGLIGRLLLRVVLHSSAGQRSRNSSDSGSGGGAILAVLAAGVALIVVGSLGSMIGGLIKAAVSRQREFLADASAVQFTRNPEGIAGALERVLASASGGRVAHPRAAELSHMYFTQGVWEGFTSLMATHPPLSERIRRLKPEWQSPERERHEVGVVATGSLRTTKPVAHGLSVGLPIAAVDQAVERIGDPGEEHRRRAAELIAAIPAKVRAAAGSPRGARAVVYGLLLDRDAAVRGRQMSSLADTADAAVVSELRLLEPEFIAISPRLRLPLLDLCLPALAALSDTQYQRFARSFRALVEADGALSLFEWTLSRVLVRHLRPKFERVRSPRVRYATLEPVRHEVGVLLSALARASRGGSDAAYRAGIAVTPEAPGDLLDASDCGLDAMRGALETLAQTPARERGRLIDAGAAVICADGHVDVTEFELLRGLSDLLDCPMPPLLPGDAPIGS